MKAVYLFAKRNAGFLGLIFGLGLSTVANAAVGFSISPSIITNDYVGEITLNITNLTPGQTVTVGIYSDLNGNGVIATNDPLTRSFPLTDGQVPLVAGVRNLNVPGDEDGLTNGQIRAVNYVPSDSGGLIAAGKSIVEVSDPLGGFSPVTQPFTVVPRVYPQSVTGRLTLAANGLPLTNTVVGVANINTSDTFLTGTDTNGNYTVYCLPGSYVLEAYNLEIGLVYSETLQFAVACGQTVTNNLALTNGNFSISGRVTNSSTGAGIPGLSVDANTSDYLAAATYTDTNGNYSLPVTPDTWSIHPSTGAASEAGYVPVTRTKVAVTNASVPNINFALSRPTAMIYGTLQDTLTNPIVGVQMSVLDSSNIYHVDGRSFVTNGNYSLGVLAGTWFPGPAGGDLAARGLEGGTSNAVLIAGQATNINFTVTRTNFPSLTNPTHVSSSQFQFLLAGLAGQSYTIQTITNLDGTNWLALLTTNIPCVSAYILDGQATNNQRFYRALVVP
jgi:hypothetical protein